MLDDRTVLGNHNYSFATTGLEHDTGGTNRMLPLCAGQHAPVACQMF